MKSEKGITLMSLIIYILLLIIVVTMLTALYGMFIKNTNLVEENSKYSGEFDKFNMYFIEDVKNHKTTYFVNSDEIVFLDGTSYKYQDQAIYRNKVKICSEVTKCIFSKRTDSSTGIDKEIITVQIGVGQNNNFETTNDYVLKYW